MISLHDLGHALGYKNVYSFAQKWKHLAQDNVVTLENAVKICQRSSLDSKHEVLGLLTSAPVSQPKQPTLQELTQRIEALELRLKMFGL